MVEKHFGYKRLVTACIILLCVLISSAQDTTAAHPGRLRTVLITEGALYAGTMIGLQSLWYSDYESAPLHHFNDNAQWLQMDKVGHAMTAYYVGLLGMDAMRWAGVDEVKSRWYGGSLGWLFLGSVELLDGYSAEWGFSSGDMLANTLGAGMLIAQDAAWGEQRAVLKFSFSESPYASLRPGTLGAGWREELLKDYNGQTYWLSINPRAFMTTSSTFPSWLSIGLGYGADAMLSAQGNYAIYTDNLQQVYTPTRQWYLGPEIDLWRIKTRHKGLRTLFQTIGFIKIPLPALKLEQGKVSLEGFQF